LLLKLFLSTARLSVSSGKYQSVLIS
jgi:hypothetical protein